MSIYLVINQVKEMHSFRSYEYVSGIYKNRKDAVKHSKNAKKHWRIVTSRVCKRKVK